VHQKYAARAIAALKLRAVTFVARSRLSISVKDCAIERETRAFVRFAHCSACGASECPARRGEGRISRNLADDFNEKQINKSCARPADRPRFGRTNRPPSSLSSRALREDLCSLPLSAFSRGSVASRCTPYHKSARVSSNRTGRFSIPRRRLSRGDARAYLAELRRGCGILLPIRISHHIKVGARGSLTPS
jgi:hypothetical protein